ncbi:hypothetical protein [Ferruginibacter albus]|uniref:hypothetical protein n=1 Tax=Ferruginibacter albus TaxID=2875540 RepID=UPI001CC45081|nr:hypothetical protein [Ferruginibacter albus]UAY50777.1 hypothetical protein K9M53_09250 [Ferruginibacter albus]
MRSKILMLSIFLLTIALLSFKNKNEIGNCFISFTTATNLTAATPDRLPETSEKFRTVKTEDGEVEVTRIDGYRILYNNAKQVPFVNLKVELSDSNSYESDKKKLLDNLKYLNAHSTGMETKDVITLDFNGYKIFGLSRGTIEVGSTLGTFIMFPGNGVTVYFYFNNLKPEFRNFESVDDYKKQRDQFLQEYTKHLTDCSNK